MASKLTQQIALLLEAEKHFKRAEKLQRERELLEVDASGEALKRLRALDHELDEIEEFTATSPATLRLELLDEIAGAYPEEAREIKEQRCSYEREQCTRDALASFLLEGQALLEVCHSVGEARGRIKKKGIFSFILTHSPNSQIEQHLLSLERTLPKRSSDLKQQLKNAYLPPSAQNSCEALLQEMGKLEAITGKGWNYKIVDAVLQENVQEIERITAAIEKSCEAQNAMLKAHEAQLDRWISSWA